MPPVSGRGTPVVPGNVGRVLWLNFGGCVLRLNRTADLLHQRRRGGEPGLTLPDTDERL